MTTPGIVGVFINGEAVLPHGPRIGAAPNTDYPFEAVIDRILAICATHGDDLRDRVVVRNWNDSPVSSAGSPFPAVLQRKLFRMVHAPTPDEHAIRDGAQRVDYEQVQSRVARIAANWANAESLAQPGIPITAVVVGVAGDHDMPDAARVVRMGVVRTSGALVEVNDESTLAPALRIGATLW